MNRLDNGKRQPHVHAELIKAWADGAEIQRRCKNTLNWEDGALEWHPKWEYRIKPSPPVEPNYGQIARETWRGGEPGSDVWLKVAGAVLAVKEAYDKALKDYQNV